MGFDLNGKDVKRKISATGLEEIIVALYTS